MSVAPRNCCQVGNNQGSGHLLLFVALILALIVFAWGFSFVGSTSLKGKVSADLNRIADLKLLSGDIDLYFQEQRKLPASLKDLDQVQSSSAGPRNLEDPTTGRRYEYKISDPYSYKLCSDFELTSKEAESGQGRYATNGKIWGHEAGYQCFKFNIPEGLRKNTN